MDDIAFHDALWVSFIGKYANTFSKREAKDTYPDEKLRAQFCAPH